ncbi:MAG: hypothetical protein [Microvirus sp.]|nr:MAG: hypothetical protein [Microvirus sp.]
MRYSRAKPVKRKQRSFKATVAHNRVQGAYNYHRKYRNGR